MAVLPEFARGDDTRTMLTLERVAQNEVGNVDPIVGDEYLI